MYLICTKDMKSLKSAKLHLIISTVKFNPYNMYVICIKDLKSVSTKFYPLILSLIKNQIKSNQIKSIICVILLVKNI